MVDIYFWQQMLTPHMSSLAVALAKKDINVYFIAETSLSEEREKTGWIVEDLPNVKTLFVNDIEKIKIIINSSEKTSIHICQGFRRNGIVQKAQKVIRKLGRREWIILETINDNGYLGIFKRILYKCLAFYYKSKFEVILANGYKTKNWLIKRGFDQKIIFSFAYFLADLNPSLLSIKKQSKPFQFIFIGRLISLKKLDLLIFALSKLKEKKFNLKVVGDGPCYDIWKRKSEILLPGKVTWIGKLKINEITSIVSSSDCLILPSEHDGWGAVISESLIAGTPVICSNKCGAAEVVTHSGYGGVFKSGDMESLLTQLKKIINLRTNKISQRKNLINWSKSISSKKGAEYLLNIIDYINGVNEKPLPPWLKH